MSIAAAIDTGGTKIVGAAVDDSGKILKEIRVPNTERDGGFILRTYMDLVKTLQEEYSITAIGIGAGGRLDEEKGTVLYAVDIYRNYIGLEIKARMEEAFGLPVRITNDCRAAVLGEQWLGAAKGCRNIFGIILGTGVGGGYYSDGRMIGGVRGGTGEIGHAILHRGGRKCLCGQQGCVEQYISGTALWSIYRERCPESQITSGYEFFELYRQGDTNAVRVLEGFVEDLAECAVNCGNLFDSEMILIGGGLSDTAEYWWEALLKTYEALGNVHTRRIPLVRAECGNRAALLGAARIAFGEWEPGSVWSW